MTPELKTTLETLLTPDGKGVPVKAAALMGLVYDARDANFQDNDFDLMEEALTQPGVPSFDKPRKDISDGYHTFGELYDHRHALTLALARTLRNRSWIADFHEDGTMFDGMFILGIELPASGTITYHLPNSWKEDAVEAVGAVLTHAPKWDGHTAEDTVRRLRAYARA